MVHDKDREEGLLWLLEGSPTTAGQQVGSGKAIFIVIFGEQAERM